MFFQWLKRYLPRSLFSRALLILIVPVIGVQIVVAVLFIQRHFEGMAAQMTRSVMGEILYIARAAEIEPNPDIAVQTVQSISRPLGFEMDLQPGTRLSPGTKLRFLDITGRAMTEEIEIQTGRPFTLDLVSKHKIVIIEVQTAHGVLTAEFPIRRVVPSNPHLLLFWMLVTSGILILISTIFLRNQVRPIRALAQMAEEFGKGRSIPYRAAGAEEVRRAGAAFLNMRTRIERHIDQRTRMLSGVSHDLRTPLTRMKLEVSLMEDTVETRELTRDISEMEFMLEEFLAFARGEAAEEPEPVNPVELAESLSQKARRQGRELALSILSDTPEAPLVPLRENAISRALQNLIDNAARYGTRAVLHVRLRAKTLEFTVEDNGPGIPADQREAALKPFARLDQARNQNKGGGVGLGLSIAADVARAHGGTLELGQSNTLGGLSATLRVPR